MFPCTTTPPTECPRRVRTLPPRRQQDPLQTMRTTSLTTICITNSSSYTHRISQDFLMHTVVFWAYFTIFGPENYVNAARYI